MGASGRCERTIPQGRLAEAARGDQAAWTEIVDIYARRVFALVRSKGIDADLAEEITQSVFATCATKLTTGQYAESGKFEAWLFRIAVNRVRDEARRRKRQATPVDPASMGGIAQDEPNPDPEAAELRGPIRTLRDAVHELGERDQEVLHLRHHAQMSFKQIAELLDEPVGTLLARHHRALQKLRTSLATDPTIAAQFELDPVEHRSGGTRKQEPTEGHQESKA